MIKYLLLVIILLSLQGCVGLQIDSAVDEYNSKANQIELGDSKEKVLRVLEPTQASLPNTSRKTPDKYMKDDVKVEIYYMRSGRQADGLTTDDEFTPYIFNDGKLVGVGWQILGGPKTHGQTTSDTFIQNTNTTVVH